MERLESERGSSAFELTGESDAVVFVAAYAPTEPNML